MPIYHRRAIIAEDLYQIQLISDVRISPDGRHVVYAQQRVDRKTEKKYANLWVVDTRGGIPRQFTFGDHKDTHPRWSPDGNQIAFLSDRDNPEKPAQIYIITFTGGEANPLVTIEGKIDTFSWSPDGTRLVCRVRKTDQEVLEREKDEQRKKLGVVSRHYARVHFKLDDDGYLPHERWHLWVIDVRAAEARQLTDHPIFDENHPAWSPDGKWIVFTSNRSEDPDMDPDAIDLYVIPSQGGEPRLIPTPAGNKSHPSFSPDGRWIAYYGVDGKGLWYKNTNLWVTPFSESPETPWPRNLTEKYDLHVSSWTINDMGQPEVVPPTWSGDISKIYFPVVLHGNSWLYAVTVDGDHLERVVDKDGVVGSFSFDANQEKMAYFFGKMDDPCQVYLKDASNGDERRLTETNRLLLDSVDLGEIEQVWIKGPSENDLQGWILKPPGFDPNRVYPSILEIHGGPLTQYGNYFMHEFYFLASLGFVVHFCNPRGGRGYGEAHARAIWGGWGGADYEDLMAWTDFIAQKPYIDPERMGVTGGSYGGYMTVWIIGHTHRFKAAVTQRCVSNLISLWGSSDLNWVFQEILGDIPPYENVEKYWDHSPMKYIGNAKTPMLVIHSEGDMRCPIEQGEQVFVALKRLGVDTEMVRFPEEFHGLSRTGRTDRRIARLNHILRWFNKFLT